MESLTGDDQDPVMRLGEESHDTSRYEDFQQERQTRKNQREHSSSSMSELENEIADLDFMAVETRTKPPMSRSR